MGTALGTRTTRRESWLVGAIIAGFVATTFMTLTLMAAYALAVWLAELLPGSWIVTSWFWALTHNIVVDFASRTFFVAVCLHLGLGLIWAVIYAYFFEPILPGPNWRKGLIFALGPWLLSLIIFLPLVGAGLFGSALGAGPLPTLGNLILHLVYGITLGAVYGLSVESWAAIGPNRGPGSDEESALARRLETGTAVGIAGGAAIGAVAGWLITAVVYANFVTHTPLFAQSWVILMSAIVGAACGSLVGSLAAISGRPQR